jgi:hypothetical protein
MAIAVAWYDIGQTILLYRFSPEWTWEEFFEIKQQADAMLDTIDHPAALIFDLTRSEILPTDALSNARRIIRSRHPIGTPVFLVTQDKFLLHLYRVIRRVHGASVRDFYVMASREEALDCAKPHSDIHVNSTTLFI